MGVWMPHAARSEEEEGFEGGVREEVEHTGAGAIGTTCYAEADEHVAKLADGREGQHALEVGLGESAEGRKDGGNAANPGNDLKCSGTSGSKKREGPSHHVDAGPDHCSRRNQRKYRG